MVYFMQNVSNNPSQLPFHPAANLFPMMEPGRFSELVESIKTHGQRVPIVLCENKILDGRNRYRACIEASIKPRFEEFSGGNPFDYVWALNGQRRDLEPGQRAAIRLRLDMASDEWEREQKARERRANDKRSETQKDVPKAEAQERVLSRDKTPSNDMGPGVAQLAARANVSEATAARVQALANKRPDLLDKVADGELNLTEAIRQVKREELSSRVAALPEGKYRIIYADPPWQYNDSRSGIESYSATAAEDNYPTMSTPDICALNVRELAADDAVLFCWATFPLLTDALEVVKAWGFKYKTAFVWSKGRPNFGHYHNASAELLLIATRGSCTPDTERRADQVQEIARQGHSQKPEEFRALVDSLYTSGPRIELFRRGDAPTGWKVWGNEAK